MNTQLIIIEFLDFILREDPEPTDIGKLLQKLDGLAKSVYVPEFKFDENEYPEPPEANYSEIRSVIEKKFPELGLYCTADSDASNLENSKILTSDAIDDLADIVGDLIDVKWYFENTTESNALWHFEFDYRSHWGLHLRELQLYLHKQWW